MSRGFRIAELSRRTGTPRETIHYYVRIGLLRKPKKSSKNMAWYDDGHVEQLKLIKRLRTESYLPLSVIKKMLRDGQVVESAERVDLAGDLFGEGAKAQHEPLDRAGLAEKLGVAEAALAEYEAAGLLLPKGEGEAARFGWEDQQLAELIVGSEAEVGADARSFLIERFTLLERHVTELVREEAAQFFASLIATKEPERALMLLRGGRESVGRYLALARARRLRHEIDALLREVEGALEGQKPGAPLGPRSLPRSPEAEARVAELRAAQESHPARAEPAIALCEALLLLSGETELVERFDRLQLRLRAEPRVVAAVAEACLDLGRYDQTLGLLEQLDDDGRDPLLDIVHAGARLGRLRDRLLASATAGPRVSSEAVIGDLVDGLARLHRARAAARPTEPTAELRFLIVLGKLETALPRFLGRAKHGEAALLEAIARTEALAGGAGDPGLDILARLRWDAARTLGKRARDPELATRHEALAADLERG